MNEVVTLSSLRGIVLDSVIAMDLAKTLIRTVARGFYETRHVLVIDALMVHSAVVNEDLAYLLGMQQKDLRKLCGKLKEDRMLAV